MEFMHKPVMLNECITGLNIKSSGIYIDCTAGGGGHSLAIALKLTDGMLIAIDADPAAVNAASKRLDGYNAKVVNRNFSELDEIAKELNITEADGILMDLGVSSHQLDETERGFSYHGDAKLDMRISGEGLSAYDVVNFYDKEDLERILFSYGEEKHSKSIVRAIIKSREPEPIATTAQLAEIIKANVPISYRNAKNPCRKTFQAIRIEVNKELENLTKTLDTAFNLLRSEGRLAIITFHSLEDRIVKTKFKKLCTGCTCPPDFPICICGGKAKGVLIPGKAIKPSAEEIAENPRSRSAILRIIEKI